MKKILVIGITSILLFSGMLVGAGDIKSNEKQIMATQTSYIDNYQSPEYGSLGAGCLVNLPEGTYNTLCYDSKDDSYFKTEFVDLPDGYDVANNILYLTWCLDHGTPIYHPPTQLPIRLHSSVCPPDNLAHENWGYINYILNHKLEPHDHMDIAVALWYFINWGPMSKDIADYPNAQIMVDDALANGGPTWTPVPGQVLAVICDPTDGVTLDREFQIHIIEVEVPDILDEWCYESETAWGEGPRYVPRGNWAMYVEYNGGTVDTPLIAGQFLNAGTVEISDNGDTTVTITITLDDHWYFTYDDTIYEENVKIQDYASKPPKKNPAPGLFAHKFTATGQTFISDPIPLKSYYGIHVDLWHQVPCDMPLWYSFVLRLCQFYQYFPHAFPLLRHLLNNYNNNY